MTVRNTCIAIDYEDYKTARVLAAIEEKNVSEFLREALKEKIEKARRKGNAFKI